MHVLEQHIYKNIMEYYEKYAAATKPNKRQCD